MQYLNPMPMMYADYFLLVLLTSHFILHRRDSQKFHGLESCSIYFALIKHTSQGSVSPVFVQFNQF
jgi:hypothetical protein